MEDESAESFECILEYNGPVGFFQKRLFVANIFLQAGAVSTLLYTSYATPSPTPKNLLCPVSNGHLAANGHLSVNDTGNVTTELYHNYSHTDNDCSVDDILTKITVDVPPWLEDLDSLELSELTTCGQAVGIIIGALFGGILADNFGRRKVMFVFFPLMCVFHGVCGFVDTWQTLMVLRLLVGLSAGVFVVISIVLPIEYVGYDWRAACMLSGIWTIGVIVLSIQAYLSQNWKLLAFVSGAFTLPLFGLYFLIPESARWLLCSHQYHAAEASVRDMISINTKPVAELIALLDSAKNSVSSKMHRKKYTYIHLFHTVDLTKWTISLCFSCLVASTVYFYLYNKIGHITGNVYIDNCLPFIIDIPLTWSAIVVNKCLGRRWCTFLYSVASGFALLSVMILHMTGNLQSIPTLVTGLCLFGKLGVTASLSLISVIAVEMYPTVIRCMGTAVGVAFTAAGSILSRQFKFLDTYHYTIPFVVFGALIISVGFSVLILPETIGRPLPNILPCRHRKIPLTEGVHLVNPWESL